MIPSLIRTVVPLLVSYIVAGLAALGIDVPEDVRAWIVGAIGTVAAAIYYAAARWAERRWPALSVLLGSGKQPVYVPPGAAVTLPTKPDPAP